MDSCSPISDFVGGSLVMRKPGFVASIVFHEFIVQGHASHLEERDHRIECRTILLTGILSLCWLLTLENQNLGLENSGVRRSASLCTVQDTEIELHPFTNKSV